MTSNLALTLEPRQCQVCHTRTGLQRCSGCKAVYYCGPEHQADHRGSHEHACTAVRKAITEMRREQHKLRSGTGQQLRTFPGANLFEDYVGRFWGIMETRDYMRARYAVVNATLAHFANADALAACLVHLLGMLRLCRGDNLGLRNIAPALYLRLGRDQQCYDFLRWWATTALRHDHDWSDMAEPYLDTRGADALEPPGDLWAAAAAAGRIHLSHAACVALVKVRILLDLRHMQNATRALRGAAPREIIDEIRGRALVSSVVAGRRDIVLASAERTAELLWLVRGQVRTLFDAVQRCSPDFWLMLVDPDSRPRVLPEAYSMGSREEAAIMVSYNCGAWMETPGAVEVIKSLMKLA